MTPLLRFVVDSKPTGLKKRAELGIVTAEIPKNRAVGEDIRHMRGESAWKSFGRSIGRTSIGVSLGTP